MARNSMLLIAAATAWLATAAAAQQPATAPAGGGTVGMDEKLGQTIPLDELNFVDEQGQPVALRSLFDRPIILTLVYYRCPGICTPLLEELAKNADHCDLTPGVDYRIVTVSFEPKEGPDLAELKKKNTLATFKQRTMPPDGWRMLTGDESDIARLADAVGFRYVRDKDNVNYVHPATVMFLSPQGKIVRYLDGTSFTPADMKMAVLDAAAGRPVKLIHKLQRLCYAYDPEQGVYYVKVNQIVLAVSVVFVLAFAGFLFFVSRGRRRTAARSQSGGPSPQ